MFKLGIYRITLECGGSAFDVDYTCGCKSRHGVVSRVLPKICEAHAEVLFAQLYPSPIEDCFAVAS